MLKRYFTAPIVSSEKTMQYLETTIDGKSSMDGEAVLDLAIILNRDQSDV